jgi:ABC-type branched-subunit amino acid transport system permease subunit
MLAIREDEIAARAMGVNVPVYKTLSFAICAAFAGLAGALFAHKNVFLSPGSFGLLLTIEILLAVVLGGLGSLGGSVLAAGIIVIAPELLALIHPLPVTAAGLQVWETRSHLVAIPLDWLPDAIQPEEGTIYRPGTQKELIFAFFFILLVRYVPNGIMGMLEPLDIVRRWRQRRQAARESAFRPEDSQLPWVPPNR